MLDTSVVVAHLRGVTAVSQRLEEAQTRCLSTVALGELYFGIHRSARSGEGLRLLQRWLQVAVLLPVGASTAEQFGRLKDQLARAGTPIPENDLWIAACALEHGLSLATLDSHFSRVPGLTVLDWH